MNPTISIIAAVGKNTRAIGKKNGLIWKIEGDLPRFKKLTTGHPIIMGRNTFLSIGRPLPDRLNIVLTFNQDEKIPGCVMAHSLDDAIEIAKKDVEQSGKKEIFIIGGGEIFKASMPLVDKLYLTIVESDEPGDIFFPDWSEFKNVILEERHDEHVPPFVYRVLTR